MKEINRYIDQIKNLCISNRVKSLFAFGAVTTEKFRKDSDIDMVVEIEDKDPFSYSEHYFKLKFGLEKILERQIDLLEQKAINNPYLRQQIEDTKVLIYGK